jgi:hypothetical protein
METKGRETKGKNWRLDLNVLRGQVLIYHVSNSSKTVYMALMLSSETTSHSATYVFRSYRVICMTNSIHMTSGGDRMIGLEPGDMK